MTIKSYFIIALSFVLNGRLFAEGEGSAPPDQSFWQTLVMIAIAFFFFYLILWRPEHKRRKTLEQQRNSLKKGDRVAAMGIIGRVSRVGEQTVIVKMYDGTKLEFYKAAITEILPEGGDEAKKIEDNKEEDNV